MISGYEIRLSVCRRLAATNWGVTPNPCSEIPTQEVQHNSDTHRHIRIGDRSKSERNIK